MLRSVRISGSSSATRTLAFTFAFRAMGPRYAVSPREINMVEDCVPRFWQRLLLVTVLAVAIFAAFSIYADVSKLGDRLARFAPLAVALALVLALGNYVIRFTRWQLYLRVVGVEAPAPVSALVFVSGFAMSLTPGQLRELVKAVLLRDAAGADVVTAAGILVLGWRRAAHAVIALIGRLPVVGRLAPKLLDSYDHMELLVRPAPLAWATLLGIAAWLCECLGFALIANGFPGARVPVGLATLIYAVTTVAGALSFVPGGLFVTEASMTLLLVAAARGLDRPAAVAATILTRLCTLWFAVVLGLVCLFVLRRWRPAVRADLG